jgi:hypothetical protein
MAGMDLFDRLRERGPFSEPTVLLEHEPPNELVTPVDVIRIDALGRPAVACPAGQSPPSWLKLTAEERAALIEPPEQPKDGSYVVDSPHGFSLRNIRLGFTIEHPD